MSNDKNVYLKYSKMPLKNFNRNVQKAQAFLRIYTVLDNLQKGKYNRLFNQLSKIGENITPQIQTQIKKRFNNDKEFKVFFEVESKKAFSMFRKHETGIKTFLESIHLAKEEILLEHALVLTISAFEIFTKDSAIILVNRNIDTHDKFEKDIKKKLDYTALKMNRYNFSGSIGNLLWDEQTFFNVGTICSIFSKIISIDENKISPSSLCKNKVHKYLELRHLIIHRNSIIDKKLYESTGIRKKLGIRYPLTKKEVSEAIDVTSEFVNHLYGLIILPRDLNTNGSRENIMKVNCDDDKT